MATSRPVAECMIYSQCAPAPGPSTGPAPAPGPSTGPAPPAGTYAINLYRTSDCSGAPLIGEPWLMSTGACLLMPAEYRSVYGAPAGFASGIDIRDNQMLGCSASSTASCNGLLGSFISSGGTNSVAGCYSFLGGMGTCTNVPGITGLFQRVTMISPPSPPSSSGNSGPALAQYFVAAKAYDGTNCQGALSTDDLFGFANPLNVADSECAPVARMGNAASLLVSCTTGFPRLQLFSGGTCTGPPLIDSPATTNGCVFPTHSFQPIGDRAPAWSSVDLTCVLGSYQHGATGTGNGGSSSDNTPLYIIVAILSVIVVGFGAAYFRNKQSSQKASTSNTLSPASHRQTELPTATGTGGYDMRPIEGLPPLPRFDAQTGRPNY